MNWIIYENDRLHGYGFRNMPKDFPQEYVEAITKVCVSVTDTTAFRENVYHYRYAPLRDHYLLTVILRQPHGNGHQIRATKTIYNCLMNADEADTFFSKPLMQSLPKWMEQQSLTDTALEEAAQETMTLTNAERMMAMLAAVLGNVEEMKEQLFITAERSPFTELDQLLVLLPKTLRKDISFHTGVLNGKESHNIAINFIGYNAATENDMFEGGMSTVKILYPQDVYTFSQYPTAKNLYDSLCTISMENKARYKRVIKETRTWESYRALANSEDADRILDEVKGISSRDDTCLLTNVSRRQPDYPPSDGEGYRDAGNNVTFGKQSMAQNTDHENDFRQPKREDRQKKQHNRPAKVLLGVWRWIKLIILLAMGSGIVWLIADLFSVSVEKEEDIHKVLIAIEGADDATRLFLLLVLTVMLTAIVTRRIVRRSVKNVQEDDG